MLLASLNYKITQDLLSPGFCNFLYSLQVGDTALHMASAEGHEEVVRLLLQSGVRDMANKVRKYFY